jgi:hypothetical protein
MAESRVVLINIPVKRKIPQLVHKNIRFLTHHLQLIEYCFLLGGNFNDPEAFLRSGRYYGNDMAILVRIFRRYYAEINGKYGQLEIQVSDRLKPIESTFAQYLTLMV